MINESDINTAFEAFRKNLADRFEGISEEAAVRPETVGAIGLFLSMVLAESDDPMTIRERLELAGQTVSDTDHDIFTRKRAIYVGTAMTKIALRDARHPVLHLNTPV